jgi:hypothetical protein
MNLSIVDSIIAATRKSNRLGLTIGAVTGGLVPVGVFALTHAEGVLAEQPALWALVGAGLIYSATSVVGWAQRLFRSSGPRVGLVKAVVWTALVEGLMTWAPAQLAWLAWACLGVLVFVNAIANGCAVALDRTETRAAKRAGRGSVSGVHRRAA